jgi:adenosylhomocysteine nucleosidase
LAADSGCVVPAHITRRSDEESSVATPFLDLPVVVPLPLKVLGIPTATPSTGAGIISSKAYDAIEAEMVDMETFAVLRACLLYRVPLVGLRGISDGAADLRHVGDWTEYLHVIDEKPAEAVDRLEQAIADEDLQWPAR